MRPNNPTGRSGKKRGDEPNASHGGVRDGAGAKPNVDSVPTEALRSKPRQERRDFALNAIRAWSERTGKSEADLWADFLTSEDRELALRCAIYLHDQAYGRASQRVQVEGELDERVVFVGADQLTPDAWRQLEAQRREQLSQPN